MNKTLRTGGLVFSTLFFLWAKIPVYSQCESDKGDVHTTPSGLKYRILNQGTGIKAERGKEIALHGIGSFENGKVFWNSRESGSPFYFVLGRDKVIKGCEEGVSLMRVGDRFLFTMKPELGYGEKGKGDVIPPNTTLIFDYEILSVEAPKASLADALYEIIQIKGLAQALAFYKELKKGESQEYNFREDQLNALGYKLLGEGKLKDAAAVLELNAAAYPASSNVYDSLGDAYAADERKNEAIENFRKSLELEPRNAHAAEMIQKLQEKSETP